MTAKKCLDPRCEEYSVREGYSFAIADLWLVLTDVMTLENMETIKEIQARMLHNEQIRIETDFTPPQI